MGPMKQVPRKTWRLEAMIELLALLALIGVVGAVAMLPDPDEKEVSGAIKEVKCQTGSDTLENASEDRDLPSSLAKMLKYLEQRGFIVDREYLDRIEVLPGGDGIECSLCGRFTETRILFVETIRCHTALPPPSRGRAFCADLVSCEQAFKEQASIKLPSECQEG